MVDKFTDFKEIIDAINIFSKNSRYFYRFLKKMQFSKIY